MWCLDLHNSTTSTRGAKPHSRYRVLNHEGPFRLEVVPEDRPDFRPNIIIEVAGSLCIQADHTVSSLFQLAARYIYAAATDVLQDWSEGRGM